MNKDNILKMTDEELENYIKENDVSNELFDDEKVVKRIAYISNPMFYMHIIKILENRISIDKIFLKRKRFVSLLFDDEKTIHEIPNEWLKEYLANYFFDDYYRNFFKNYHQMRSYLLSVNQSLVNMDHLSFYESFSKINRLSSDDIILFFKNNCDKKDMQEIFYDDMRIVKDHCYKNLVSSSIKLDESKSLLNKEMSNKYNIPVYYLDGEKFYAFVRAYKIKRDDLSKEASYFNGASKYAVNFSYIGKENITIIGDYERNVVLLYDSIDPNDIMYVFHDDSGMNIKGDLVEHENTNELLDSKSLMLWTNYYNDIIIKNNDRIKPSALVCLDKITDEDILFARKYQLSIVLINSKKYYLNNGFTDYMDRDSYSF